MITYRCRFQSKLFNYIKIRQIFPKMFLFIYVIGSSYGYTCIFALTDSKEVNDSFYMIHNTFKKHVQELIGLELQYSTDKIHLTSTLKNNSAVLFFFIFFF